MEIVHGRKPARAASSSLKHAVKMYVHLQKPHKPPPEKGDTRWMADDVSKAKQRNLHCGSYFLGIWNASAHGHEEARATADSRSSAIIMNHVHDLLQNLSPLSQIITTLFQVHTPATFCHQLQLVHLARSLYPMSNSFFPIRRSCQLFLAIIANGSMQPHCDTRNRAHGLDLMTPIGSFRGGELYLDFGKGDTYVVEYKLGDIVILKGAVVVHWIGRFEGEHYGLVWFSHEETQSCIWIGSIMACRILKKVVMKVFHFVRHCFSQLDCAFGILPVKFKEFDDG
ncbi:hypothetical protein BT69DRAFT_1292545 [Atractiella rhizophila]|nr:hypothetical protein BT69DRAFT_1292545 [Atractiella rhizophila]